MSSENLPPQNTGDQMERALPAAMDHFIRTKTRPPRPFDAEAMIRKTRRRTWTIAAAAAAVVLVVSGGSFAVVSAVRGSDHPNVPIGTTQSPSPSTSPGSTSPSQSDPGQPLTAAETSKAIDTVAAIYGDFEVFDVSGYTKDDFDHPFNTSARFTSHSAYAAAWGNGKMPSAPMACGTKFNGSVVGDPVLAGSSVTVPVQFFNSAKPETKQAIMTLVRSSMKVSKVTCKTAPTLAGTTAEHAARTALSSFFGPYFAGDNSPNLTKWFTSGWRAGPQGTLGTGDFSPYTCSQEFPQVWVIGRVIDSGSDATASLRLFSHAVPALVDVNSVKIAFLDCTPMPTVPHPASAVSVAAANDYLSGFFEAYHYQWAWRAYRPVKPQLNGYFAEGVLDESWSSSNGLLPTGCGKIAPNDYGIVGETGHKTGTSVTFDLYIFNDDDDSNPDATAKISIDLRTLKITDISC